MPAERRDARRATNQSTRWPRRPRTFALRSRLRLAARRLRPFASASPLLISLFACSTSQPARDNLNLPSGGPIVRVLLLRGDAAAPVRVCVNGAFRLLDSGENTLLAGAGGETRAEISSDRGMLRWSTTTLNTPWAELSAEKDGHVAINGCYYRGTLRFLVTESGGVAAVNVLPLEDYLAGVVRGEIPRRFSAAAQRALVIAARTYALFQILALPADADYHVSAGEKSQMYLGVNGEDAAAVEAVRGTGGLALVCGRGDERRIFESFYCSTCGGRTLSASAFNGKPAVEALRGGVACACQNDGGSPHRSWPDVRFTRAELTRRLVRKFPPLETLGVIVTIEPAGDAEPDRWTLLKLTGESGRSRVLSAEELRVGLGDSRIRSARFEIRADGDAFVLTNGRGFGHGVGLCQFGADGMARTGCTAAEILLHYYPGAEVVKVY